MTLLLLLLLFYCRRRNRRPSAGIASVQSWSAGAHPETKVKPKPIRRPDNAPPLPPLRPNADSCYQYVDARTAVGTAPEQDDEYLTPTIPAGDQRDTVYSEPDDQEGTKGNEYLELVTVYRNSSY